jgi:hypothetical protein
MGNSASRPEHDEVDVAGGLVVEMYPNRNYPHRIYYRFPEGGIMDLTCKQPYYPCPEWFAKITGFRPGHMPRPFLNIKLPEGEYLIIQTDDPRLQVIKNADTAATVGYWVTNKDFFWIIGSYQEAQAMEEPH